MTTPGRLSAVPSTHPVAVTAGQTLTPDEARYVDAARAANTVRGYRADWTDFTTWCDTAAAHRSRRIPPPSPATSPTWPGAD